MIQVQAAILIVNFEIRGESNEQLFCHIQPKKFQVEDSKHKCWNIKHVSSEEMSINAAVDELQPVRLKISLFENERVSNISFTLLAFSTHRASDAKKATSKFYFDWYSKPKTVGKQLDEWKWTCTIEERWHEKKNRILERIWNYYHFEPNTIVLEGSKRKIL